jgi:hypothetical protein
VFYDRVVFDRRGLAYSEGVVVKDNNDPVGAAWYKVKQSDLARTLSLSRCCPEMVANLPPAPVGSSVLDPAMNAWIRRGIGEFQCARLTRRLCPLHPQTRTQARCETIVLHIIERLYINAGTR